MCVLKDQWFEIFANVVNGRRLLYHHPAASYTDLSRKAPKFYGPSP